MRAHSRGAEGARGQVLAIFAISASVLILMIGLAIDGGGALVERRESQNASDFAAMAGARVIAQWIDENANEGGVHTAGTDANVVAAINKAVASNGATPIDWAASDRPYYVREDGSNAGPVGTGTIPGCGGQATCVTSPTVGVTVATSRSYRPYFLGLIGVTDWTASSVATARGGFAAGGPTGAVFPAGIALAFFETYPYCDGEVGSSDACTPQQLTPGNLNVPGGFGWLKSARWVSARVTGSA